MDNQTVIAHADLYVRNLFVNITDYPNFVRGQGGSSDVKYGDVVSSVAAATDVELLLYKSETNYPNTNGHLIRVWYEIGFQLKAANATADIIYQLQAKDKNGTWVDMSAAVTVSDIGTSYVAKLIKGYLDIQSGISKLPFEMRLIFQSNESDTDLLISFTCTWSSQAPGGSGSCRAVGQYGDNLYGSFNETIYYQTGNDSWSVCTGDMGQVRGFAVSDVSGASLIYCVTNSTMRVKGAATQVWADIGSSPSGAWSILHQGNNLYVGTNGGDVEVSTNGSSFATTSLTGGGAVMGLVWFGSVLYAACKGGKVWKRVDSVWSEVGTSDLSTANVDDCYCLCEHNSRLYLGTNSGTENVNKIFILNVAGNAWADTGDLTPNYNYTVFGLVSFLQDGEPSAVLFAATGNSANVFYYTGSAWVNTGALSGDYQALCIGVYTKNNTIYVGSNNYAKIWKASISATWESGEGIARLKNDEASDGQKTKLEIVGRIV